MKMSLSVLAAVAALSLVAAQKYTVEDLGEGLYRVRTGGGSCLNRYGIIPELPVKSTGNDLGALKVTPGITMEEKGFSVRFPLQPDTAVYGLGDVCRTNVNRRGATYEMWVKNVKSYIPIPMAITTEGWGVFLNSTFRSFFDVGDKDRNALTITAAEGDLDFYFFTGRDLGALLEAYTRITGRPTLLPIWGYAFTYVCNENVDEFRVLDEAEHFRRYSFPCDVIGLEPGWMSKHYDYSTQKDWDPVKFHFPSWAPNGASGTWGATEATIWPQALAGLGFKLSLWLCCDYDLFRYEEQCAAGVARKLGRQPDLAAGVPEFWEDDRIKNGKDAGSDVSAKRRCPEKNFEEGKLPWFEHLKKFVDQGAQAFKLDGALQVTEHKADRVWANGRTTAENHNLYSVVYDKQMSRGYEEYTGKRAMVYSAGGYAGVQQYVATWAGDTGGGVKPLASILNHGLSGHVNQSCDMQIGDPKSRHFGFLQTWSQQNNWYYWKQAWYTNPEKQEGFRMYGELRYRILPYLYTAAARAHRTAWPVVQPLALAYPEQRAYEQTITTYKLGDALLVSAFSEATEIPDGVWYDWWTDEAVKGPVKRPETIGEKHGGGLYVKAGAIIPTWPLRQHVEKGWNEEVIFEVWPGADGVSELYEDDGVTLGYREGKHALTSLRLERLPSGALRFTVGARNGSFDGMPATRRMKVRLHLPEGVETRDLGEVGADGASCLFSCGNEPGCDPASLTRDRWLEDVKPEVLKFFSEKVYGKLPPKPAKLDFELAEYGYAFDGLARRRQYVVHAEDVRGKWDFNVLLYLPREQIAPKKWKGAGKLPVFVYPNFCGNWTLVSDPKVFEYKGYNYPDKRDKKRGSRPDRVCVEELLKRGFGFATFCFNEVYPDDISRDVTEDSVWKIFDPAVLPGEKLAHPAWSWGSMRVRDLLELIPEVDQTKIAIVGQSRMGKNAINTGVNDERYSLTCANCGGTKSLRHLPNLMYPCWFSRHLAKYVQTDQTGLTVEELERRAARFPRPPFDQSDYIACIAPRAVVISTATGDRVSRPEGSRALFDAVAPVYRLFGKEPGWHIKEGNHSITHEDWRWFMDYAEKTLGW